LHAPENEPRGREGQTGLPNRSPQTQGITLGPLPAHLLDSIRVGDVVLFLAEGTTCNHPIGVMLRVTYAEREGIKEVRRIVRMGW